MAYISKTDYLLWRECPKNAWLRIHRPDLYNSFELTEFEQSIIDAGIEVEETARKLFPQGTLVTGSIGEVKQTTRRLLASHPPALFQPVFEQEQLLAKLDVLQDNGSGEYSIYEIKSATEVKQEHVYDLAFQALLLRRCGVDIKRTFIILLNPHYVRECDLDIQQLFMTVDMTDRINQMSDEVIQEMTTSRMYLLCEDEPQGPCSCVYKGRSKHCGTFDYSNPTIPKYGIHDIARIGSSPKKLKELVEAGIFELESLPVSFKLTEVQRAQLRAYRTGEAIIDKPAISKELSELSFPLHFIDYETFASPLPLFPQYSPYNQVPLQYSVHIVGSPGEEPIHRDFLHSGLCDPSTSFVMSLKQHVAPFGAIIVWNKGFESHVNDEMARRLPAARDYLYEFNDRVYDLMDIFTRQYFVHKDLCGKVSIKKVLPVLAPQLSYSSLAIHDGAIASLVWMKMITGQLTEDERAKLRGQLREYCALDSFGMYAIWQALMGLIRN
jgi:hypothetical protein